MHDSAVVVDLRYEASHYETHLKRDPSTGDVGQVTEWKRARFTVVLHAERAGSQTVEISEALFHQLALGESVRYTYHRGHIGGSITHERIEKR